MDKERGRIKVDWSETEAFWKFSIADNGPGIDKKYFKKIFKIFQTLAPSDEIESIGIGLSIVKKIVNINSGRIWVESEVGKGSIFFFTLSKKGAKKKNKKHKELSKDDNTYALTGHKLDDRHCTIMNED